MKTLYLIRHAKTQKSFNDMERELLPIGIERANKLGNYLSTNHFQTDVFYSSCAKRAEQTARIIAEKIGFQKDKIIFKESLYLTSQEAYFDIILEQSADINAIMIVGHNHEITNVARFFVPDFTSYMQTGACFCFDFDTDDWSNVFTAERKVRFYMRFE